jgi:hypothetical protein
MEVVGTADIDVSPKGSEWEIHESIEPLGSERDGP